MVYIWYLGVVDVGHSVGHSIGIGCRQRCIHQSHFTAQLAFDGIFAKICLGAVLGRAQLTHRAAHLPQSTFAKKITIAAIHI